MQSLQIWNGYKGSGPNPWKVILVLSYLDLPYDIKWIKYLDAKKEPYLSLNPNGRLPAMEDPNTGVALFESGAIINYVVDLYDKEHKLSYGADHLQEKYLAQSWLMFQMSGQGPMFGQRMWFVHFHVEESLDTALSRYGSEVRRICGVVEYALQRQRKKQGPDATVWLVGDKCTYADLVFVPWSGLMFDSLFPGQEEDFRKELAETCPEFIAWHERVIALPAVKKVLEYRAHCMETLEDSATESLATQESRVKI